ncbi:MAG TPA: hypothetical protein VK670_16350 [Silvibacterium sp.]|nr:hypothetical protein [Silvibacterium sp.]
MHTNVSSLISSRRPTPLWVRAGFWICTAIAVAVVIRRIFALAAPPRSSSAPPQLAALDNFFASQAALTLAHIIPALAFVLVAPFVFRWAAWAERFIFPLGAIVGITAYAMSGHAVGGWIERSAVLFFNTLFLYSLLRSWLYKARQDAAQERTWLLRSIAVLLGIATTRPVMGVFFATSRLTHLTPQQFFGIAFWIGFSINTLAFEFWIRSQPGQAQSQTQPQFARDAAGKTL